MRKAAAKFLQKPKRVVSSTLYSNLGSSHATSAALLGYELVDGGLGTNNLLGWLWTKVLGVSGPARSIDCFLSIGTGISANSPLHIYPMSGK
ncbi:hypothetical protein EYZ11_003301 [Aspergillus tanneri]|uniref:PNPLA domain-containing protein n=1 Tax=Aspergillus tanneri TaxID=1220188 RepID=A0A4S3JNM7_9EURO|nr:hypothetical protein EYZ11_003301 [Aspergillus tanneri]